MLFNKSGTGSAELKALIGFIYKSINFDNLKSYIRFAEAHVKRIIGKEVFATALAHYNSENYQLATPNEDHPEYATLDELVQKIQYPMAVHAYRKYVPSSDLTHSDKGRQIFVSDQEKPAFEWQIEKDNENLLRLAGEATDLLIEFLDEHIDDVVYIVGKVLNEPTIVPLLPWGTSDAFKATRELMIPNVGTFETVFLIGGSRLTFLSLAPIIKRVQENEIMVTLGETRYAEILDQFLDGDLTAQNLTILNKVRQPLALLTMAIAAKRLTVETLPDGVFSNLIVTVIRQKMQASKIDRNEISVLLEKDGMRELRKLQDYLAKIDAAAAGSTVEVVGLTDRIYADELFVRL